MVATDERLLSALREMRAIDREDGLGRRLLEVVQRAMRGTLATLRHPLDGSDELRVGTAANDDDVTRIERRFSARSGVAVLMIERSAQMPFDDDDASLLEALTGELVLRLEQERAEDEANRLRR